MSVWDSPNYVNDVGALLPVGGTSPWASDLGLNKKDNTSWALTCTIPFLPALDCDAMWSHLSSSCCCVFSSTMDYNLDVWAKWTLSPLSSFCHSILSEQKEKKPRQEPSQEFHLATSTFLFLSQTYIPWSDYLQRSLWNVSGYIMTT